MNDLPRIPALLWRLLFAAALVAAVLMTEASAADCGCTWSVSQVACAHTGATPASAHTGAKPTSDSWVFARSRYTHDPDTGGRVAQYAMKPPVEPLPDQRAITSGYTRTRTVLRGADGASNATYRVQSYGNGRGGLDAEWERFHDAWRGSTTGGGNFQAYPQFGFGGYGYGGYGHGGPGYGAMGGFAPGGAMGRFAPGQGPGNFGGGPSGVFPPNGGQPGFRFNPRQRFGPGYGRPDAGRLDPDGADGYHDDGRRRTPDRRFFDQAVPTPAEIID